MGTSGITKKSVPQVQENCQTVSIAQLVSRVKSSYFFFKMPRPPQGCLGPPLSSTGVTFLPGCSLSSFSGPSQTLASHLCSFSEHSTSGTTPSMPHNLGRVFPFQQVIHIPWAPHLAPISQLAQLVENQTFNLSVKGLSPPLGANFCHGFYLSSMGDSSRIGPTALWMENSETADVVLVYTFIYKECLGELQK